MILFTKDHKLSRKRMQKYDNFCRKTIIFPEKCA